MDRGADRQYGAREHSVQRLGFSPHSQLSSHENMTENPCASERSQPLYRVVNSRDWNQDLEGQKSSGCIPGTLNVARSSYLEQYSKSRPASGKRRSIPARYSGCGGAGDEETSDIREKGWELEGWKDEPSIPESSQLASARLRQEALSSSRYFDDLPVYILKAKNGRPVSAGASRPAHLRSFITRKPRSHSHRTKQGRSRASRPIPERRAATQCLGEAEGDTAMSGEPPVTPASSGRSDDCGTVPVLEQQNKPPPGPSTSEGCEEGVLVNRDCGASTSFGEYVERSASSDVVAPEAALPSFISPFSDVISGRRGNRAAEASRRRKPKDKVSSGSQVSENPAGDRFSPDRSRSPRRRPNQLHGNCNSSSTVQGTGDCLKIRPCSHRGVQESSEKPVASASPCGTAESPSGKSQNSVHNQGLTGDGRGMNLSKEEPPKKEDNAERILTHFDSWNFWRQNETVELKAEGGGFVSGTGASECLIICHEESDNAPETTITPPRSRHAVSRLSDPGASFSMEDMEQLEKKWSKEQTRGRRLQWYEHRRSGRWSSQNQTQPKQPDTPSNGLEPLCLSGAQMLPPKSLISNQSENDDTGSKHEGEEPLNQVVQTSSKPRGLRQTMSFPASIRSIPPTKQNNRGGAEYQMKVVSRGNGSPKMIKTAVPGTNFIRLEPSPRVSNPSQPSPSTQSGESDAIDEMLHDHRKRSDSDESFKKAASINRTPYFGRALMHISSEDGGGKEVNVGDDSFVSSKVDDLTMVGVKVHGAGWV